MTLRPGSQVGKAVSLHGTTARSNRVPASTLTIHPADSSKLSTGLNQHAGLAAMPTAIPLSACSARKTSRNDLPQLPRRMPQIR